MEADTDAIMGEELPTTTQASTSGSGETGNTTAADTKSDIKLEARSTSAQSMQKSKEQQQTSQITSPDLGSEETVNNFKKESGNNSVKDSTGGI